MDSDLTPSENDVAVKLPERGVSPVRIEDEMNKSFLDYSMSVIVGRALPAARRALEEWPLFFAAECEAEKCGASAASSGVMSRLMA